MKKFGGQAKKQRSKKILGDEKRPRIVFSKSNQYLTVQAVDDTKQHTIAYLCTRELVKKNKEASSALPGNYKSKEIAGKLGVEFAKNLNKKSIKNIIFDRNGYIYHGKIKAFCDKMRE